MCYIHVIYVLYTCYIRTGFGGSVDERWSKGGGIIYSEGFMSARLNNSNISMLL